MQYVGPVEILALEPSLGYTDQEIELSIFGENLMLLLGHTRAFCEVGQTQYELTIVDH